MKFAFALIFFVAVFGSSLAFWSACTGSILPTIDSFESPSCTDRCRVTRGDTFYGTIRMTFREAHQELQTRVTAFIFGIGVNIPIDPAFQNQCDLILFPNGTRAGCPTIPNQQYMIQAEMLVSPLYPAFTNTRVQIDYLEANERVFCYQIWADVV
ncbi:uncharacterized protein [Chironomus tepperi]|uniref:uncharacterized protein n=1 Tax=Chironomus tepperi TaxID=113505 RepID=UPI00391F05AC